MSRLPHRSLKSQMVSLFAISAIAVSLFGSSFFTITSHILQKKEEVYVDNTIQQLVDNLSSTADRMSRYAYQISQNRYTQLFLQNDKVSVRYEYSSILSEIIPTITERIDDAINVVIIDLDGNILGFQRKFYSIIDVLEKDYDAFNPDVMTSLYTSRIFNAATRSYYYAYFTPILSSQAGSAISKKIGTCVIMSSVDSLTSSVQQIKLTPNARLMVLDDTYHVLVSGSEDESSDNSMIQDIGRLSVGSGKAKAEGTVLDRKCVVQYREVPNTGWQVLSVVPLDEIYRELTPLFVFSAAFFALILTVILFWSVRVMRGVTNPIAKIAAFVEKGPNHNLHNRLVLTDKYEIGVLEKHINLMLDEISQMTDKVIAAQSNMYETELSRKQAEISALQSQINPHFLYNTLDCIKGYGYLLKSDEIIQITTALSAIMRYCIKGPDMVAVEDEMNCVKKYLSIISIRFNNRFDYVIDIAPEIFRMEIPRFLLQPVVENAIYHGLEPKPSKGTLRIHAALDGLGGIVFRISDDGAGMKPEDLEKVKNGLAAATSLAAGGADFASRGIGLLNINNRIRIQYGPSYGLSIDSAENISTVVTIVIPAVAAAEPGGQPIAGNTAIA